MPDFLTKAKFSRKVQDVVSRTKLSYMDAVIHICEEHTIDPEDVKKFLSTVIKDKIEAEAISLHYLPKEGNELPFS